VHQKLNFRRHFHAYLIDIFAFMEWERRCIYSYLRLILCMRACLSILQS
jgi:hypothetical protein